MAPRHNVPRAIVIRAAGTNCDGEMVRAFTLAGARADLVHLDRLVADPAQLEQYDLFGFPGGFSYGDDIASGRVFALRIREHLFPQLRAAVDRGACVIGACNGFQVLVQVGLLPGGESTGGAPSAAPEPSVALTDNIQGRFIDRWLRIEVNHESPCIWTQGLGSLPDETLMLPVAHGEGRFAVRSPDIMTRLENRGQIAMRYAETDNVNGSQGRVAGICDPTGRVFALMPHPERYLAWENHPFATGLPGELKQGETPGLRMFRNAVEHVATACV